MRLRDGHGSSATRSAPIHALVHRRWRVGWVRGRDDEAVAVGHYASAALEAALIRHSKCHRGGRSSGLARVASEFLMLSGHTQCYLNSKMLAEALQVTSKWPPIGFQGLPRASKLMLYGERVLLGAVLPFVSIRNVCVMSSVTH